MPLTVAIVSHDWSTQTGAGRCARELHDLLADEPAVTLVGGHDVPAVHASRAARVADKAWRAVRVWRTLRRGGVEVAIVNSTVQSSVVVAARLAGCRVVWWCHESGVSLDTAVMRLRWRVYDALAQRVVSVSRAIPGTRTPQVRIRNIVRTPPAAEPSGPPVLLVIGTKCWRKGTDLLAGLVDPALGSGDAELWVVGRDEPRETVLLATAHRELEESWGDRLRWLPGHEDPGPVYDRAAVLLLPSRADARPRVVEEALAHGLPVVASILPGMADIAETLTEPRALACVDLGDDWSAAITAALALGRGAGGYIEEFTDDEFVGAWLDVLAGAAVTATGHGPV